MRTLQTFIVRILNHDDFGPALHGQISEPGSADEWRANFTTAQELFEQILTRLATAPGRGDSEQPTWQTTGVERRGNGNGNR